MMKLHRHKPQFLLMIGDEGALLVPHRIPEHDRPIFAAHDDKQEIDNIIAALAAHAQRRVTLFADNLAQDFRREGVPRLSPLDRPRLIKRRLTQAFPQARLTASINLKSSRTHILMAGLHDSSPVFTWLERLKEYMPRICLLPVEAADMAMKLLPDAKQGWAMLLSRQRTGGFRQIVTHKGELIFTRLTPPLRDTAIPEHLAEAVERDITASLGYLTRLGLTDTRELRVMLLMPDATHDALADIALPVHSLTLLSPHKTAKHLKLPFIPYANDSYADLLYAGWLAHKGKARLPIMLRETQISKHSASIQKWGMRVALLALAAAVGMTMLQAGDLAVTLYQTHREAVMLEKTKEQLNAMQVAAAPVTEPLGKLRQAVERQHLFSTATPLPWTALAQLNSGLGDAARVSKIDWQSDGSEASESMQLELRLTPSPSASSDDRENIIKRFQQIAANVKQAMPDYAVNLTRYPFPATPDETLSNSGDSDKNLVAAQLSVRRVAP
jgi:hypothetical protein